VEGFRRFEKVVKGSTMYTHAVRILACLCPFLVIFELLMPCAHGQTNDLNLQQLNEQVEKIEKKVEEIEKLYAQRSQRLEKNLSDLKDRLVESESGDDTTESEKIPWPADQFPTLAYIEEIQPLERRFNDSPSFPLQLAKVVRDISISEPAHFPLPTFGSSGENLQNQGALIYEGMRFIVGTDGKYQVRFVVGTPAMPVTIRLQLVLLDEFSQQLSTLTLPPITIPRKERATTFTERRRAPTVNESGYLVHHEGHLPMASAAWDVSRVCTILRKGTARFGYGVDVP